MYKLCMDCCRFWNIHWPKLHGTFLWVFFRPTRTQIGPSTRREQAALYSYHCYTMMQPGHDLVVEMARVSTMHSHSLHLVADGQLEPCFHKTPLPLIQGPHRETCHEDIVLPGQSKRGLWSNFTWQIMTEHRRAMNTVWVSVGSQTIFTQRKKYAHSIIGAGMSGTPHLCRQFLYVQKLATYLHRRRIIRKSLRPGTVGHNLHTASWSPQIVPWGDSVCAARDGGRSDHHRRVKIEASRPACAAPPTWADVCVWLEGGRASKLAAVAATFFTFVTREFAHAWTALKVIISYYLADNLVLLIAIHAVAS